MKDSSIAKAADSSLSDHFSFYELTNSTDHPGLVSLNRGVALESPRTMNNLRCLCKFILEPIREILGDAPLVIGSGYRCAELNSLIPGSSDISQHMRGEAADPEMTKKEQFMLLEAVVPDEGLRKELLLEKHTVIDQNSAPFYFHQLRFYPSRGFAHVSLPTGIKDMQISLECK